MRYDEKEIAARVSKRKRDFLIRILCPTALILSAVIIAVALPNNTVIFLSVLISILTIAFIARTLSHYHPMVLFSKEILGENVKEHEFVVTNCRPRLSARLTTTRWRPRSVSQRGARTKPPTSAVVYLRLPDGNVTFIDGLSGAHTDVYEIGDTLYKYPGTRYPIIRSREVKAQPCPICGTVNKLGECECITCHLKIF